MPRRNAVCIIPARGGSKRIPGKNLLKLAGVPLVVHSVRHALASKRVDRTLVSTDDDRIARVVRNAGGEVVIRPPEISGDKATSESAVLHALDSLGTDPELVVFLQPTSPVRRQDDIDRAIGQLERDGLDSLFSACRNNKLLWRLPPEGPASFNYDYRSRKREQDFHPEFRENGSIYVFKPRILREFNNRLGGRMGIYEMPEWASFQLDEPWERDLLEWILKRQKRLERL